MVNTCQLTARLSGGSILRFSGRLAKVKIMTKEDILQILNEQRKYIGKTYEVNKIGLFGSYAKGTQTEDSDIDIYVELGTGLRSNGKQNDNVCMVRATLHIYCLYDDVACIKSTQENLIPARL